MRGKAQPGSGIVFTYLFHCVSDNRHLSQAKQYQWYRTHNVIKVTCGCVTAFDPDCKWFPPPFFLCKILQRLQSNRVQMKNAHTLWQTQGALKSHYNILCPKSLTFITWLIPNWANWVWGELMADKVKWGWQHGRLFVTHVPLCHDWSSIIWVCRGAGWY